MGLSPLLDKWRSQHIRGFGEILQTLVNYRFDSLGHIPVTTRFSLCVDSLELFLPYEGTN